MITRAFFKVYLVLTFLNTIVEKHTLNPEIILLFQCRAQKLFKVPKICNINLWIENDPPTFCTFPKKSSDLVAGPFPKALKVDQDQVSPQ